MFTAIIFTLLLSGSVFASSFFSKKFEEVIPITCMSISAVLFLFGLFGQLSTGFYFVLVLAAFILVISALNAVFRKGFIAFCKDFFTPAFFVFAFLFLIISYFNNEKQASGWDEFSHWVDSVKAMYLIDDFVTNENSFSMFKSYPPAMTLFQYFFVKLAAIVHRNSVFCEDKVYIAYQTFAFSFFFPLLKNFSDKKIFKYIIASTVLLTTPLFFFKLFLSEVYIDPFVAIVSGCAISAILLSDRFNTVFNIYIVLTSFTLVLAKDVGLYFAIFIFICYMIKGLGNLDFSLFKKSLAIKKCMICILPLFAAVMAKLLWKMEIVTSHAEVMFGGKIDIVEFTRLFFFHKDSSYKKTVAENFKNAFFGNHFSFGDLDISISYFNLTIIIIAVLVIVCSLYNGINKSRKKQLVFKLICSVIIVQTLVYVYSLGATYVSNFSEYEAVRLASYSRYMNIAFLSAYIVIVALLLNRFFDSNVSVSVFAAVVAVLIIMTPFSCVKNFVNKNGVRDSISFRSAYSDILQDISQNCKEKSKIYFISQEDQGMNYYVVRYSSRPCIIDNVSYWSIGEGPFYDGDIWTKAVTEQEFKDILVNGNYDYVAIYNTNEYFNNNYGSLFYDSGEIENSSLFEFDKKAQKLRRVDAH